MDNVEISFEGDVHICGSCKTQSATVNEFISHKQNCLKSRKSNDLVVPSIDSSQFKIQCNFSKDFTEKCIELINDRHTEINFTTLQQAAVICDVQNQENNRFEDQLNSYLLPANNEVIIEQKNNESSSLGALLHACQETMSLSNEASMPGNLEEPESQLDSPETENPNANVKNTTETKEYQSGTRVFPTFLENNLTLNKPRVKYEIIRDPQTNAKRFRCCYNQCMYSTVYMKDLVRHSVIHTGIKPYFCKLCDKRFSRLDKLRTHELTHSGKKPHKCSECSYAATDRSSLLKHLRIHKDERPFKCQICTYASRNSSQLTVHLRRHTGDTPFHCTLCKMKFKMNSDLKRHMFLHTGEKPFSCTKCPFQCNVKGNLTAHIHARHSEGSNLKCDQCSFATSSKSKFREHEWCHRNNPLRCNHCQFSATTQSALKTHQHVHSKEKPFRCEHCSYTSRQVCNVRTHTKKHHPETLRLGKCQTDFSKLPITQKRKNKYRENESSRPLCLKSFKCTLCQAAFVRKDSLDSHLRHHQNQMLTQVINWYV